MRSTESGPGILLRGVWKFAMTWIHEEPGFHVVENNNDEWVMVPEYHADFSRLRAYDDDAIRPSVRWW